MQNGNMKRKYHSNKLKCNSIFIYTCSSSQTKGEGDGESNRKQINLSSYAENKYFLENCEIK